jgi:hypothetical protein
MITLKQTRSTWSTQLLQAMRMLALRYRPYGLALTLALMMSMGVVGTAAATQTSKSSSYSVTETQIGGGSQRQCGTAYCAKSSAGDTAVGQGSSASYSAQFGSNTTDVPLLQVIADGGNHDVGVIDNQATATATFNLQVRNYLMNGYAVQISGSPPKAGSHTLTGLTSPSTSHAGAEQFGINLVDNTAPDIGADPYNVPDGDSALSYIKDDYKTADIFAYNQNATVAENLSRSGETHYTISMILNVSAVTPGGQYKSAFSAVVVPNY